MTTENTVHVTRHFTVPSETVFDAWLDERNAGQWLFATPTGQMVRVSMDPREGGAFTIIERRPDGDAEHRGAFLEVTRPSRLVFTFRVPQYPDSSTTVTVGIAPEGDGCDVTLSHGGVMPQYAERTMEGWSMILDGLARTVHSG